MTPAAFGSAPSHSPYKAKAAPGLQGEALLARIGNTPLLPLDALARDRPPVKLLGKAEWNTAKGARFQSFRVFNVSKHASWCLCLETLKTLKL
jgi:hypothetical protein